MSLLLSFTRHPAENTPKKPVGTNGARSWIPLPWPKQENLELIRCGRFLHETWGGKEGFLVKQFFFWGGRF